MRKLLITNLYNMYNAGEIMQLETLRQNFPDDKLTIASIYSIIDKQQCHRLKVSYTGHILPAPKPKLAIQAGLLIIQAIAVRLELIKAKGIIGAYQRSDMIIDLGGDTFSDSVSPLYTLVHCFSLFLAVILNKAYVICSQSIGKFKTPLTRVLACFVLNQAKLITIREAETAHYITEELHIPKKLVVQAPEIAYLVAKTAEAKIPHSVGILAAALSKKQTGITAKQNTAMLTRLATYYTLAGWKVVLIPHITCPIKSIGAVSNLNDKSIAERIKEHVTTATIGSAKDCNRVSLLIGSRMHGLINALVSGTPVVALSYSHKFQSLNSNSKAIDIKESLKNINLVVQAGSEAIAQNKPNIEIELYQARRGLQLIKDTCQAYQEKLLGKFKCCYFGHSAIPEIRQNGGDGGVATSLLMAARVNPLPPQGTEYHHCEVEKAQLDNKPAIICLPCQVTKYRQLYPQAVIIGLFCAHSIKPEGIQFLVRTLGLRGFSLKYRHKQNGQVGLLIDNKAFISVKQYWSKFFNYCFIPSQCLRCKNLTAETADISLGTAHKHPEYSKGKNVIITRTQAGVGLLQNAVETGLVEAEETNPNSIIATQKDYIRIKKGQPTPKLKTYLMLRNIGSFLSSHRVFRLVLKLWIRKVVASKTIRLY